MEILAEQVEIQTPIEILNPRVTRYQVGKMFSKIVWAPEFGCWKVFSRSSGRVALIGANNVKGVILAPVAPDADASDAKSKARAK